MRHRYWAKLASVGFAAVVILFCVLPTIAANASETRTAVLTAASPSPAAFAASNTSPTGSDGELDDYIFGYIGEGAIATVIVMVTWALGKERVVKNGAKRDQLLSLRGALEDYMAASNKFRYRELDKRPFDAQILADLYTAKGKVDAAVILLPGLDEAVAARKLVSEDMDKIIKVRQGEVSGGTLSRTSEDPGQASTG
jgi:hypothetical protein